MKQKVFNILISLIVGVLGVVQVLPYLKKDKPPEIKVILHIDDKEKQPDFFSKSPQEGLMKALEYYEIKHPHIVYAQAVLETGNFTSNLCLKNNNLFGLYDSKNKRYYSYKHWWESIEAYKKLIQRKYNNSKYYYMFLEDIKYARDKDYINKVKKIAEELE